MSRAPLPESRLKARKRRRARILYGLLGAFLVALLGSVVWLSWQPFLRIREVRIEGAQTVATSTLEKFIRARLEGSYFGMLPKDNVFLYPKSRIVKDVRANYPRFADVSIAAGGLTSLVVALAERAPAQLWCGASPEALQPCLYLDASGAAYAQAPAFSGAPYARYYGELSEGSMPRQFLSPEESRSLFALVDAMGAIVGEAESVWLEDMNDASARFSGNFVVKFSRADDPAKVFERFALALKSTPFSSRELSDFEYLDLRFGDKLYYKLR